MNAARRGTSSRCSRRSMPAGCIWSRAILRCSWYCTKRLRLSEHAAYGRIEAARVSRKFPAILHMLAEGSITLTTICLLSNHLTEENHEQLLKAARHKTRREVEGLVAALHPMPPVPSSVRRLTQPRALALSPAEVKIEASSASAVASPAPTSVSAKPTPARPPAPPIVRPACFRTVQGSVSGIGLETHRKLRRLQDLLRHSVPNADLAEIFDRALSLLLREMERQKIAMVDRPRNPGVRQPDTSTCASVDKAEGMGARRGTVRVCRDQGPLRGTWVPRIPSCDSVCRRRRNDCGEPAAPLPRAQRLRGEKVVGEGARRRDLELHDQIVWGLRIRPRCRWSGGNEGVRRCCKLSS